VTHPEKAGWLEMYMALPGHSKEWLRKQRKRYAWYRDMLKRELFTLYENEFNEYVVDQEIDHQIDMRKEENF
jgi:hypothetical protein